MVVVISCSFSVSIEPQEDEIKDKGAKIERAEQRLTTLSLELKVNFVVLSPYKQAYSLLGTALAHTHTHCPLVMSI